MGPIYDFILMLGDLILILLFLYLLSEMGLTILDQLYNADARVIQEYASGFLSMSGFAPDSFVANQTFPKVSHLFNMAPEPPLVEVKVGSRATITRNFMDRPIESEKSSNLRFVQKQPLPYTLLESIVVAGSCIGGIGSGGCIFSTKSYNAIEIVKHAENVAVSLLLK